jgi:hypothetical protein
MRLRVAIARVDQREADRSYTGVDSGFGVRQRHCVAFGTGYIPLDGAASVEAHRICLHWRSATIKSGFILLPTTPHSSLQAAYTEPIPIQSFTQTSP